MFPIQQASAEIEIKPGEQFPEPFSKAIEYRKYEIVFFRENKAHTFYCSEYIPVDRGRYENDVFPGEWTFNDVIMDTSKRDPKGKLILVRMTYHPQISLVNVPFMVLPAPGEKDIKHEPGAACPRNIDYVCGKDNCTDCPER